MVLTHLKYFFLLALVGLVSLPIWWLASAAVSFFNQPSDEQIVQQIFGSGVEVDYSKAGGVNLDCYNGWFGTRHRFCAQAGQQNNLSCQPSVLEAMDQSCRLTVSYASTWFPDRWRITSLRCS